ncbi:MAG TPA: Flp family type IVb pilin [Jiangellaceae bacterium]
MTPPARDDQGAVTVEYALIAALVALAALASVGELGVWVRNVFDAVDLPG